MGFTKIYTKDRKASRVGNYIIKEMKGDDHKSLTTYVHEYCEHISHGNSYITCFYFHFQTTRKLEINNKKIKKSLPPGTNFIVMANCMPGADKVKDMYDLKGSADDKTQIQNGVKIAEIHKRCWSPMNCGIGVSDERKEYAKGKKHAFTCDFIVTSENRKMILSKIKHDTDFLAKCNLMDYSLLVGVKRGNVEDFIPGITEEQPYLGIPKKTGEPEAYYIGIIDFLQGWNWKKDVAHCLKTFAPKPLSTVRPGVYGPRFYDFFVDKFKASDDESNKYYCEKIRKQTSMRQLNVPEVTDNNVTIALNEPLKFVEGTSTFTYGGQKVELKENDTEKTNTHDTQYQYTFPLPADAVGDDLIVGEDVIEVAKTSTIEEGKESGPTGSEDIVIDMNN